MCGIVGLWRLHHHPIEPVLIQRAATALRHRGPDDEGYLLVNTSNGGVRQCSGDETIDALSLPHVVETTNGAFDLAFGFRRLSILDLSAAGHQPMVSADGNCWLIFNGEIYNYLELRTELAGYGHHFHSDTDTEVILTAYQQWGGDCLARLNGMWALALWDNQRRQLFCARDRFGIKPFYYFWNTETFAFASEIKALLHLPGIPRLPHDPLIYDYLYRGNLDHTDETCFAGIKQLLPARALVLHDKQLTLRRYWSVNPQPREEPGTDDTSSVKTFYNLFEDAVRLHLRSDVAIGTCLSGGLDSSAIVGVANKLLFGDHVLPPRLVGEQQKTFSSCFTDERFDERKYIEQVLAATGAEPNYTFPDGAQLPEVLPELIWHQDEPFVSTSIYAQWRVMAKAAERGVKVLLDGQGGDELVAGYPECFAYSWKSALQQGRICHFLKEATAYHRLYGAPLTRMALRLARLYAPSSLVALVDRERHEARLGLCPDFLQHYRHRRIELFSGQYHDPFADHLYLLLTRYRLPALLHYEDRNSMAHSIEARVPFLDYRLVEFVFALPGELKIKGGLTKAILRDALRNIVPEPVRLRTDKMGFVTPERLWLANELHDWVQDIVHSARFRTRGYFQFRQIVKALDAHAAGKRDLPSPVWRWINLELWLRRMIEVPP
ncbi:MAG: asparagine synthase (glutamine-hydrolyzing) [Candidatus Binatia bacterium]